MKIERKYFYLLLLSLLCASMSTCNNPFASESPKMKLSNPEQAYIQIGIGLISGDSFVPRQTLSYLPGINEDGVYKDIETGYAQLAFRGLDKNNNFSAWYFLSTNTFKVNESYTALYKSNGGAIANAIVTLTKD
jgi:hypothetical protein